METRQPVVDQIFGANKAPLAEILPKDFADMVKEVEAFADKAGKMPKKVKNDTDLGMIGTCVADIRDLSKRVDDQRKTEGDPLFKAKKELDAFFNGLGERLTAASKPLMDAANDYNREKQAKERARLKREADELREREEAEWAKAAETTSAVQGARAEGRAEQFAGQAERLEQQANGSTADLTRTRSAGVTASATTKFDFRITDYDAIPLDRLRPYFTRDAVEAAIRSLVRIQRGAAALPGVEVFPDVKTNFRR